MQRVIWDLVVSMELIKSFNCKHSSFYSTGKSQMRRKQDRLARMDAHYQKRKEIAEFELRREERLEAAEERMAKKRLKRQKKQREERKAN